MIDDIKKALEEKCPKVVSCADILTAAARDATLLLKGPFWSNEYGRKDGRISIAQEAEELPNGHEDVTSLIEFYQSKGLSMLDLVVLSGILLYLLIKFSNPTSKNMNTDSNLSDF